MAHRAVALIGALLFSATLTVVVRESFGPEVQPLLRRFARGIVRLSLRVLPPGPTRARYEEQFQHDIDEYLDAGRGLSGVLKSFRIAFGSIALSRVYASAGSDPLWFSRLGMQIGSLFWAAGFIIGGFSLATLREFPIPIALGYLPAGLGVLVLAARELTRGKRSIVPILLLQAFLVLYPSFDRLLANDSSKNVAYMAGFAAVFTALTKGVRWPLVSLSRLHGSLLLGQAFVIAIVGVSEARTHSILPLLNGPQRVGGFIAMVFTMLGGLVFGRAVIRYRMKSLEPPAGHSIDSPRSPT